MTKLDIKKIYGDISNNISSKDAESIKSKFRKIAKVSPAILLAGAVPAEGQIVCETGPITIGPVAYSGVETTYLDLNNDGTDDFFFSAYNSSFFGTGGWVVDLNTNSFVGGPNTTFYTAANLPAGFNIGPTLPANYLFDTGNDNTLFNSGSIFGNFYPASTPGYLGVRFDASGNSHYGWVELTTVQADPGVTLVSWGYNSTPGQAIAAGDCSVEIVPTVGEWAIVCISLLLMIFGAVAIRQKETEVVLEKS